MKKIILSMFLLGTLLSANAQVPGYVPKDSLKGWWPFSGNANDASVYANHGTLNGPTLTTDRFGNPNSAYSFDGVNDDINLGVNSQINKLNNLFTISFFLLKKDLNSSMIIGNIDSSIVGNGWRFNIRTTTILEASIRNSANWYPSYSTSNSISQNIWIHIVCVRNNTTMKIYLNGILNSTTNIGTVSLNNNPNAVTKLGKQWANLNPNFESLNGKLDDLGIWNRALTQQEVESLYNANICYQTISVTDTLIINVNRTSYNPLAYTNTIKVYPNPTKDKITIDNGDLTKMTGYSIKIYNSVGQQLYQTTISQQQYSLDITQWGGNGLYFLELKDNNGNIVDVKKIVLQ